MGKRALYDDVPEGFEGVASAADRAMNEELRKDRRRRELARKTAAQPLVPIVGSEEL